ncbi:MAG: tail assembly chaperone [Staphylococcus rostri]|uniref:tail assembly chaperone n=1 Tax=Staphylococcus rostri TaxID=522262 RepID=UPI0026DEF47C|nr:tail assembly chaperone [Staphylococcus rostri]MDO5375690.1 tail assembly chaperone [Staphylococcus rostri]
MTQVLKINGKDYTAKGSISFVREAKQFGEFTEVRGQKTKGDGVTSIFMGLLQQDPEKLAQFWYCAVSNLTKNKPQMEQIEQAIEAYADENGEIDTLFKHALLTLRHDGIVKGKIRTILDAIQKKSKEEDKEQLDMFNEMYNSVTGETLFNKA